MIPTITNQERILAFLYRFNKTHPDKRIWGQEIRRCIGSIGVNSICISLKNLEKSGFLTFQKITKKEYEEREYMYRKIKYINLTKKGKDAGKILEKAFKVIE